MCIRDSLKPGEFPVGIGIGSRDNWSNNLVVTTERLFVVRMPGDFPTELTPPAKSAAVLHVAPRDPDQEIILCDSFRQFDEAQLARYQIDVDGYEFKPIRGMWFYVSDD